MFIAFVSVILLFMATGLWVGYSNEKKWWNNGRCLECSDRWVKFDTDSHGGRGYVCPCCSQRIWISWPVDKKEQA